MGHRRENRGPKPRTDLQILDSVDIDLLQTIDSGSVTRMRAGASLVFVFGETPIVLRRLEREDLCTAPIGGLPMLLPRGRQLLQVVRGELPEPMAE